MTSPALPPAIAALGQQIARMQAQIAQLQRNQRTSQLGTTSIDNGALVVNDPTGNQQLQVGLSGDGTFTVVSTSTTAPPIAPDTPVVAGGPLSVLVTWDGLTSDGNTPLNDFAACQVHCSPAAGFTPSSATLAGHLTGAGTFGVGGLDPLTTYYVALVIVNEAGLASPASAEVSATAQAALPAGSTVEGVYFLAGGGGGTTWLTAQPGSPGYYLYWDTGTGNPQVVYASAATGASDQWGGNWQSGVTLVGIPGVLPNVLTVTDTAGDVLAGIDSSGNVTGTTVNAGIDVIIGGTSLAGYITGMAAGVVARGWTPGTTASPWPATALSQNCTALLELDFTAAAGRDYQMQVLPAEILLATAPTANTQYVQRLFYTVDGSTPAFTNTGGQGTPTGTTAELAGHSPGITPVMASTVLNYPTPYQEYLIPVPAAQTAYRFLAAGYLLGSGTFRYSNSLEMRVTDLGTDSGQFMNAGAVFGAGTTGGAGGTQTYTETFYAANTYSYYTNLGLRDTNGNMVCGAYSGEAPNYQYAFIGWANGNLGHNLYQILSSYTVNWASLRLTNLRSYYSNGMRFGLHSSTSLGGSYSGILNPGGNFIGEGATSSYGLTGAQWTALFGASTYTVLAPDPADYYTLTWYGWMYGGGGSTSYMPAVTVSFNT